MWLTPPPKPKRGLRRCRLPAPWGRQTSRPCICGHATPDRQTPSTLRAWVEVFVVVSAAEEEEVVLRPSCDALWNDTAHGCQVGARADPNHGCSVDAGRRKELPVSVMKTRSSIAHEKGLQRMLLQAVWLFCEVIGAAAQVLASCRRRALHDAHCDADRISEHFGQRGNRINRGLTAGKMDTN